MSTGPRSSLRPLDISPGTTEANRQVLFRLVLESDVRVSGRSADDALARRGSRPRVLYTRLKTLERRGEAAREHASGGTTLAYAVSSAWRP
jgi:hypothetical protein